MKIGLLGLLLSVLIIAGCATVGDNMTSNLHAWKGVLTKAELFSKAGAPTDKMSTENGEVWVYKYSSTRSTYSQQLFADPIRNDEARDLMVTITFNSHGVMNGWEWSGYASPFPGNPFALMGLPQTNDQ